MEPEQYSRTLEDILNEPNRRLAFLQLEERYRIGNDAERAAIREGWPFDRRWYIPGLGYSDPNRIVFASIHGVDAWGLEAEERIEARLTYHAIENARYDFRDTALDLCLCYHVCLILGLDVVRLFDEAAEVADRSLAASLRARWQWPPESKSLWAMGFGEEVSQDEIAFVWIGSRRDYDDLKPKHLDSWGREITP